MVAIFMPLTSKIDLPRLWPGTRGTKKAAPKAQGAQKKERRKKKKIFICYLHIKYEHCVPSDMKL